MVQTSSIILTVAVVAEEVIYSTSTWVGISPPSYYGSECPLVSGKVSVGDLVGCETVCDSTSGCNAINLEALGAANTCSPLSCPGTTYLTPSLVNAATGPQTYAYYRSGPPTPPPSPTPSGHHCASPLNCWIPSLAYPCSMKNSASECSAAGGVWEPWGPAPTPVPPAPGPAPTPIDPSCSTPMLCKLPLNCYHAQWGVPCSQAADEFACTSSSGVWCWKTIADNAENSTFSSDGASGWATHNLGEVV